MRITAKILLYLFIFTAPCLLCAGGSLEVAQKVFDRLYQVHGHFNPRKPKLEIVSGKQHVAVYSKYKNTIQLEEAAYALCRSFGKDSLDALAFILAHELIHAIQIHNVLPKTSFISYDKSQKSSLEIEQNADIQGIFASYLAGFKTIQIIPKIIDKMYTVYELRTKNIRGYPSETERKNAYKKVIEQAGDLIELFELANELTIIEEYQGSIQCLEYISKWYQGKEVYNNLGVNYALMALNFTKRNNESFIYPLELDWNLRIKKPKTGRGEEELDPIEKIEQLQLFTKAKLNFNLASELDPNYALADLNLFCVLIMMNELTDAKQFYRNQLRSLSNKSVSSDMFLKIKSANAILAAKQNNTVEAIKIWKGLTLEKNKIIATQAEQNLSGLSNNKSNRIENANPPCITVNSHDIPGLTIKIRNLETKDWIALDSLNGVEKGQDNQSRFYSCVYKGWKILNVQKITVQSKLRLDVNKTYLYSLGGNKWIYPCKKEKQAYILNENNELISLIRYHHFKEIFE